MAEPVDLTKLPAGSFGYWTILSLSDRRTPGGAAYWRCRCKCGKIKDVAAPTLVRKSGARSGSCGCRKRGPQSLPKSALPAAIWREVDSRGLTIKQFARIADLNYNTVQRYLSGKDGRVSLKTVAAILAALGKPWAWLDEI